MAAGVPASLLWSTLAPPSATQVTIDGYELLGTGLDTYVAYRLRVEKKGTEWIQLRRFREFVAFNSELARRARDIARPPLPGKSLPLSHASRHASLTLAESRRACLERFIQAVVADPRLCSLPATHGFLGHALVPPAAARSCSIPLAFASAGHHVYQIRMQIEDQTWCVLKRFAEVRAPVVHWLSIICAAFTLPERVPVSFFS